MSSWVLVTNARNFAVCHTRGLWGDTDRYRIAQLHPGDRVALYIRANQNGEQYALPGAGRPLGRQLGAIAKVVGRPRETNEHIWPDRIYPWIIDLKWESPYPPATYLNLRSDPSDLSASQGDFMIPCTADDVDRWERKLRKRNW